PGGEANGIRHGPMRAPQVNRAMPDAVRFSPWVRYGALSVVIPAALFARGMARQRGSAGAALVGLFGWELVKIAVTVAMLAAASRLVPDLSWLALLVGMVVTMKTYWIALMARPGVRKPVDI
ncbi:MAG: ATP synthase subunit I, partial [Alcaligenaceae bacterium]